jgi:hypothetical protein
MRARGWPRRPSKAELARATTYWRIMAADSKPPPEPAPKRSGAPLPKRNAAVKPKRLKRKYRLGGDPSVGGGS